VHFQVVVFRVMSYNLTWQASFLWDLKCFYMYI